MKQELNPQVVYFSPAILLSNYAGDYDPDTSHGLASKWELPSNDVIHPIADAVISAIEANGIEPCDIVLSGYDRDECPEKVKDYKIQEFSSSRREPLQSRIDEIAQEMNEKYEKGTLSTSARKAWSEEVRGLREQMKLVQDTPEMATYFFCRTRCYALWR